MREQEAVMEQEKPERVAELKARLERGDYEVDPGAVADALLRRLREMRQSRPENVQLYEPRAQNECSNPASSPEESEKPTRGGPFRTRPIHVSFSPTWVSSLRAALVRAFGATQTQSS
jgi:Anti-sigma-28 factor, FlgM